MSLPLISLEEWRARELLNNIEDIKELPYLKTGHGPW
jgi:hypothetical protein